MIWRKKLIANNVCACVTLTKLNIEFWLFKTEISLAQRLLHSIKYWINQQIIIWIHAMPLIICNAFQIDALQNIWDKKCCYS